MRTIRCITGDSIENLATSLTEFYQSEGDHRIHNIYFLGDRNKFYALVDCEKVAPDEDTYISLDEHRIVLNLGRKTLKEVVMAAEEARIKSALKETDDHRTKAAKLLGITRKNLWEKMRNYGMID